MFNQHLPYLPFYLGGVSWGSVLAGTAMALALWMVLAVIGLALGFKVIEPKSDDPASGLGKTLGIWYGLSVLVSMAGGAFMAGNFAAYRGLAHGLLMWSLMTIVIICFSSHAVSAVLKGVFSTIRGIGSGAAEAAGMAASAGKGVVHTLSETTDKLTDKLHLDMDVDLDKFSDKLNDNVSSILRDTGSEALQPERLKQQVKEIKNDLKKLVRQIGMHPGQASQLIADFTDKEKNRLQNLTGEFDRDTVITTLMNNRNIPRDEAETLVNNAVDTYNKAVDKAKKGLTEINDQIEEAKEHLKEMADEARDKADKIKTSASKGAAAVAAAIILAAIISMGFGYWGAKCATSWHKTHYEMQITTR